MRGSERHSHVQTVEKAQKSSPRKHVFKAEHRGLTRFGNKSLEGTHGHPGSRVKAERARERPEWFQEMVAFSCLCSFAHCRAFQGFGLRVSFDSCMSWKN